MRTNIVIDDELLSEAMKLSGATTKKEVIVKALKEFVFIRKRRNLLKLAGKIRYHDNYDYKAMRK
ncbi:hypothetical protein DBT_1889 [Dissulfuribacter thermophilus]|uniref:Uncharacterized protein n=1 Tax=Dissulfuribacter thermophilus TaxID=1156395 RepID=A0A1B9F4F3_9BACT|nr:type II toxin-antitoxin system VapB family antitoxin [Dissulfuribacter thermophilus]OCC14829.1 hypothetical protein DBT_1889 [Dissulfuribacter thermophilus]